ncbi:Cystathionine beta-lyase [Brevundimonas diminuta]|uniref:cystathionine beta-lyase n=1 Tax=Brevundimonas diminuta TaxID=293 RepID=UPI000207EB6F|nr:cystathionine beta-lyase [Brevundimonas diminuta]EGF94272.1 cystathionine beta-lyase [Brevundimonas diminuta ATCC 11568]OWR20919.1 cystathionine beta-lyase [Brevundimonas diminuta]WQE43767.1 cystathionine beta-lyase [Brevundimonas diminuta]SPU42943.1 Cystathionine beta-lyase [Brevundimonas diminuta]SUW16248.1 Cystathionine beta-lyase [Brevundimonas diminuta]
MPPISDRTRLIAGATRRGQGRRPVNPPVERASTMLSDDPARMQDASDGPVYGLDGTSAARELRSLLAQMEGGTDAFLVPSGLAAVTVPLTALLRPGDEVLTTDAVYGPTRRFLTRHLAARGITARFHPADASAESVLAAITPRTRLLLIEAPASLTFEIADAPALAAACRERGVLTVMDNTWAAGLAFRPLAHGVDVSVQALTKYVGGHSDLLMGGIAAGEPSVLRSIANTIEDMGWHVSPDDAWLALRGVRTLPLRYEAQARSALTVAQWLKAQPEVADVLYPPLPGSVGHDLWRRDFDGAASLMGVVMKGGDTAAAHAFMRALSLFGMGYSWGGFESLITHETPQLAHRQHAPDLSGQLLRLHIGLEDPADLIGDLEKGLKAWRALQDSNLKPAD